MSFESERNTNYHEYSTAQSQFSRPIQDMKKHKDGRRYDLYKGPNAKLTPEQQRQLLSRDFKINLREEYQQHLAYLSQLENFKEMKMRWDQTFWRSLLKPHIMVDAQDFEDIDESHFGNDLHKMGEHLMQQDAYSIIDSRYQSYIGNKQEEKIPKAPILINQNKKLIKILFEAKETIDEEIHQLNLMTTEEQEKACTVPEMKEYFHKIMMLLDRWMKVMTHEEGDFVSSLIIDQIFKCLVIKLDKVYGIKDRIVDEEQEFCKKSISKLKRTCKEKLELQLTQFKMRESALEEKIKDLTEKIEG